MSKDYDVFSQGTPVEAGQVKFTLEGDKLAGTLIETKPNVKTRFGLATVYTCKVKTGSYHPDAVSEPVQLEAGENAEFFAKGMLDDKMKRIKLGQIFGVTLTELKDTGKGNPQKIYVVNEGIMDPDYMGEEPGDEEPEA